MKDLSFYVAPWSLPGETIPLYVEWEPSEEDDIRFKVELPENSEFKKATNVKRMTKRKNLIYINELKNDGFFGVHFASPTEQEEVKESKKVVISSREHGKVIKKKVLSYQVVRPKLELDKCPDKIVVTDDTDLTEVLVVELRQLGSGFVRISVSVFAGGRILSSHEDLIWNFIKAMIEKEVLSKEELKEMRTDYGMLEPTVEVGERLIGRLEEEFESIAESLPTLMDGIDLDMAEELAEVIREMDHVKLVEIIVEQFERFLTGELIRTLNKYPGDRSMLVGGRASTELSKSVDHIHISIVYSDSMGNEYEPVECEIGVKDNRTKHFGNLIPVNIIIKKAWLQSL